MIRSAVGSLTARFYDRLLQPVEAAGLRDWRQQTLSGLSGSVLEIGAGTGLNLPHYPISVSLLVLTEPDVNMRKRLKERVKSTSNGTCKVSAATAEALPFRDEFFQTVVGTLVLCSVSDPVRSLGEIRRVLSPGGRFLFIEHVAARETTSRRKWQRRLEPVWRMLGGNCHLTRSTERQIEVAGFRIEKIIREEGPRAMALARPVIRGSAVKLEPVSKDSIEGNHQAS